MEIKLQCPIKQGTKVKKWYAHNTELGSLTDFFLCETQGFGEMQRDYAGVLGLNGHNGLDIAFDESTEIYASHDGKAQVQQDSMAGIGVVITAPGYKTIYWHMKTAVRKLWESWDVKAGDLIGYGDSTGYSTGHHLHYGLKLLNPDGSVKDRNNGFDGAIDPTPFIVWWDIMTQEEVKKLYRLAFYRDPDAGELAYWTGKPLVEFLNTAIKDRANFLLNT